MILSAEPLACGNAVLLKMQAEDAADAVRVLRRLDAGFTGPTDPAALLIYEGGLESTVDAIADNGTTYFYKDYSRVNGVFVDDLGAPVSATPEATYASVGIDTVQLVRTRVDYGLRQELTRGLLVIKPPQGEAPAIAVRTAPPQFKNTSWPVVSVMMANQMAAERGIGETIESSIEADISESFLSDDSIAVEAWSQNPDERNELRKALRRVLIANGAVFSQLGLVCEGLRSQDVNFLDGGQYEAPVYCASFSFTLKAPAGIAADSAATVIDTINVNAVALNFGAPDTRGVC